MPNSDQISTSSPGSVNTTASASSPVSTAVTNSATSPSTMDIITSTQSSSSTTENGAPNSAESADGPDYYVAESIEVPTSVRSAGLTETSNPETSAESIEDSSAESCGEWFEFPDYGATAESISLASFSAQSTGAAAASSAESTCTSAHPAEAACAGFYASEAACSGFYAAESACASSPSAESACGGFYASESASAGFNAAESACAPSSSAESACAGIYSTESACTASTSAASACAGSSSAESKRASSTGSNEKICCICLGEVKNRCVTKPCKHEFCYECLEVWAKEHVHCPYCRQRMEIIIHNITPDGQDIHNITEGGSPTLTPTNLLRRISMDNPSSSQGPAPLPTRRHYDYPMLEDLPPYGEVQYITRRELSRSLGHRLNESFMDFGLRSNSSDEDEDDDDDDDDD